MSEADDPSYGDLISRLYEDGKHYAKTKALLYRALVKYRVRQMRLPIILFMTAVALSSAALMAILLGLVLALAASIGGLAAGLLVGIIALLVASLLVVLGWKLLPDLERSPFHDNDRVSDKTLAERDAEQENEIEQELTENG